MLTSRDARLASQPTRWLLLCLVVLWARIGSAACGDRILDPGEACDDGNVAAGDCCSADCTVASPSGDPCADDGNPCSLDQCDASGICTHPTGGNAPCDDGDPCTTNDVCGGGVCAGTVLPETCVDAVLCRRARSTDPVGPTFVGVDDGLAIFGGSLRGPVDVCLPASTTGGTPLDPAITLVSSRYRMAPRPLIGFWSVTDEFGTIEVQTRGADRLLVASTSSPVPPPPAPPAPGSTNHYACRRARLSPGSPSPSGTVVTVDDALGSHTGLIVGPRRLCRPTDLREPGTGMAHPRALLMCYGVRIPGATNQVTITAETSSQLGTGSVETFRERELCVPAAAEMLPVATCLTTGDECGLPCCKNFGGQRPDCGYHPVVTDPRYLGCAGPTIHFDRTHANFHQVTPESVRNPGRFWGFAKLLAGDGYVVRDSAVPLAVLLPTIPGGIVAMANPRTLEGPDAVPPADVALLVDWVEQGGSLFLSIDHPPFEKTEVLLAALGLEQFGRGARKFTFTVANGGLNAASPITAGVDEVTTFTGTAFRVVAAPPPQATYDPILTFPPDSPNNADGWLQGVAIQFGAGRVYLSGESGGLTAQNSFGMQETPDNEQFVRNIVHWLDD